jgi:lysyl-tRNA synthetase class 2
MQKLIVEVDPEIATRFPYIMIGGFTVRGLHIAAERIDDTRLLEQAIADFSKQGLTTASLSENPSLAGWRQAFQVQGLKPSRYRTSPEALARRALRGDSLQTALPIVNAYNAISLQFLAPLGAYDLERLPGRHMVLRFARPASDTFTPLGADASSMPLLETVAVYAMADEILCWGFNHRDSHLTCLQPETTMAAFFSEGVIPQHHASLVAALSALRQLFFEAGAAVGDVTATDRNGAPLVLSWASET